MEFLSALHNFDTAKCNLVIPDIKCYSPKDGDLLGGRSPLGLAQKLISAGAPVLSVVTEEKEFHGSLAMLKEICSAVNVPVLRKDFVQTREDLAETVSCGAKAILLMYSCLGKEKLHELYADAKYMGLTPFVETHTKQEIYWALELGAELIGINNRDILQLERDDGSIAHTKELLVSVPPNCFVISESSIKNADEVRQVVRCGAKGVLVGTAILKATDTAAAYRALTKKVGIKICGMMSLENVAVCSREEVDLLGFVVDYPVYVPWNISQEQAKPLIEAAKEHTKTVVVTGGDAEKVFEIVQNLRPDCIQLHYKENFEQTAHIAKILKQHNINTIRSIPTQGEDRINMFGTADLAEIVEQINKSDIYGVLFDSRDAQNASTGGGCIDGMTAFHREVMNAIPLTNKKVFIAGGIDGSNAWNVIDRYKPDYIDVMTGIEDAVGKKSFSKLQALIDGTRRLYDV